MNASGRPEAYGGPDRTHPLRWGAGNIADRSRRFNFFAICAAHWQFEIFVPGGQVLPVRRVTSHDWPNQQHTSKLFDAHPQINTAMASQSPFLGHLPKRTLGVSHRRREETRKGCWSTSPVLARPCHKAPIRWRCGTLISDTSLDTPQAEQTTAISVTAKCAS